MGALSLLLREILPLEALSSWAERAVGVMLIGIGIWGLRKALNQHVHVHEHTHGGHRHAHIHVHDQASSHSHAVPHEKPHAHNHAAFAVGTLHGLAGSSHFLGVSPALAFPTTTQAISYLIAYGAGSILAMAAFSSVMGMASRSLPFAGAKAYQAMMIICSVVAVGVGGYWLVA